MLCCFSCRFLIMWSIFETISRWKSTFEGSFSLVLLFRKRAKVVKTVGFAFRRLESIFLCVIFLSHPTIIFLFVVYSPQIN